jgi:rRNA maturation RNase YbeY
MPIRFFYEEIEFKLPYPLRLKQWISLSASRERRRVVQISYIFCTDPFLLRLNEDYLQHHTLTDIITFDESHGKELVGEIYISLDRIAENADKFQCDFQTELRRVMIHGVLHMCGYRDKRPNQKKLMRKKEDAYLSLWEKLFHVKRK